MYADRSELAQEWRNFAAQQCHGYSPLYEAFALAVAGAPDVLDLTLEAPLAGRQPNVLLAAVQDLRLRGKGELDAGDPGEAFCRFVRAHRSEVAALLAHRRTNTNECGRSAVLVPALRWAADRIGAPIALLDVGTSAGINLHLDRFLLDYGAGRRTGPSDAAVRIGCTLVGDPPITAEAPPIAARLGLDQAPVDLADPDEARWLLACVWPDTGRLDRTRAAIDVARADPVELVRGDVVDDVAGAAGKLPDDLPLCVMTSWVLAYLPRRRRAAFVDELRALSRQRPVAWISAEGPGVVDGLPPIPEVDEAFAGGIEPSVLAGTIFLDGDRDSHVLGRCHPHGTWLQWTAAGTPS